MCESAKIAAAQLGVAEGGRLYAEFLKLGRDATIAVDGAATTSGGVFTLASGTGEVLVVDDAGDTLLVTGRLPAGDSVGLARSGAPYVLAGVYGAPAGVAVSNDGSSARISNTSQGDVELKGYPVLVM